MLYDSTLMVKGVKGMVRKAGRSLRVLPPRDHKVGISLIFAHTLGVDILQGQTLQTSNGESSLRLEKSNQGRGGKKSWESGSLSPLSVQFSSVAQSCLTLCNPLNCSTPGFPVHHQLPELTQTHVHRVVDAIQPSNPLSSPSPPAFSLSQHQGLF